MLTKCSGRGSNPHPSLEGRDFKSISAPRKDAAPQGKLSLCVVYSSGLTRNPTTTSATTAAK